MSVSEIPVRLPSLRDGLDLYWLRGVFEGDAGRRDSEVELLLDGV